jgi:branched-chain amino acid transport system permease protein
MTGRRRYLPILLCAAVAVVLQLVLSATGTTYYMTQLTMSAYYALVVIGLCLLMGYAGQISLGHAGFFAIGGYTTAVLTTRAAMSPWLALAAALLLAALLAWLIGLAVIRLKGHYLAMATLGFGLIVYRIVLGTPLFGQADGIWNVPPLQLVAGLEVNGREAFRIQNYYIAWLLVSLAMVLAINLVASRVGRSLLAIHQSEEAAESLGIDTFRSKLCTFVLSAVFAAAGGVLLTHYNGSIGPSEAAAMKSVRYVAIVAVGGMGNLWGALAMGILLNFLSLRGIFGTYDDMVFGTTLIGIMLLAPNGLIRAANLQGIVSWWIARRRHGRHAA